MSLSNTMIINNAGLLSALYSLRVPKVPTTGQNWETYALAALARTHYTLETILANPEREVDCAVLLRSMFEHVVTFAWLLIDAPKHHPRLLHSEYLERKKMCNHLKEYGIEFDLDEIKGSLVEMGHNEAPGSVLKMCEEADSYWGRLGIDWQWNFARSYANLYRFYSKYVHPTVISLDSFITPSERGGVIGQPVPVHGNAIQAEAVKYFAGALAIASCRWSSVSLEEVTRAFVRGISEEVLAQA